jgi:hypothetical protein
MVPFIHLNIWAILKFVTLLNILSPMISNILVLST